MKGYEVPGLPDSWPELVAEALSELNPEEFEAAWRAIGQQVRASARGRRSWALEENLRCPGTYLTNMPGSAESRRKTS